MKRSTLFLLSGLFLLPTSFVYASGVSVTNISPSTSVSAGTPISLQIETSGYLGNAISYTLSDSLPGSTLANSNINAYGKFNWNTTTLDIGTHNITFSASDTYGSKNSILQTIVIRQASPVSVESLSPGSSVYPDKTVSFSIAAPGFVNPTFSINDSYTGSSISGLNLSSAGNFSWKPTASDVGIHNLTVYINGTGGRTDTVNLTLVVNGFKVQNVSANSLPVGTPLTFNILSYGLNLPSYNVTDSLGNNTISNDNLSNGSFNWTPKNQDIGNHFISITMTDNNGATSNHKVNVVVTPLAPVITTPPVYTPPAQTTPSTPINNTTPTAEIVFKSNLKIGSTGTEVTALQKVLINLKFLSTTANGNFGPATEKAVKAYQKSKGLPQLGVVGPATRAALNGTPTTAASSPTTTTFVFTKSLAVGSTGTEVSELQKYLTIQGYYSGPINGSFGSLTKAAVMKFQKAQGIAQQGNVGPSTRAALNK